MTYNPWLDAHQRYPEVHIEWHPIAPYHAVWVPSEDVVLVDEHISRAEQRCALAHEIAHMDTGDVATDLCWFAARQETVADKLAARRLVDVHELLSVMRWTLDSREIAEELDVSLNVLAIRRRWLHPSERGLIKNALSRRVAVA